MTPTAILIVEDEKLIAKGIEKQLRTMGYSIAGSASNGEEAVRKAVELHPDLILMDIFLGAGIDGVEAAERINRQMEVPVIYLTAHSDPATLQRAKMTAPFGYILKPYEDKDLQTAIEIGQYRHKMERRLREHEQWLAATLGSIGDGVIAIDEQCRLRFLNVLAEQLTGWTQADAIGRDVGEVFQIVSETSRQPVKNPALDALEKEEPTTLAPDTLLIDKAGVERPIDDSAAPIRDVNGKVSGAVLVFRDITERKKLEEQVRQSQKMEAIGSLAGGLAHDFNNLLTVINGYSELIQSQLPDESPVRGLVREIGQAGERAASLTRQLLAFSRKQVLEPKVLNLNAVVTDMATMLKRLIGEDIDLKSVLNPLLGQVKADPGQIEQILINLFVNARDAMPQGGKLTIETANAELDETYTQAYQDLQPGPYVMLAVADTGTGMDEQTKSRIFEPFFTTKRDGKGTGMGLATVFGIVKQSGGHVAVYSEPGHGATFKVYLPRVDDCVSANTSHHGLPHLPQGKETILLVEDEPALLTLSRHILQRQGYTVLEASLGEKAINVAERHLGNIHLLVTDVVMPGMSGRQVAERITAQRPGVKVLFLSGYTDDAVVRHGVLQAETAFLQKPYTPTTLAQKVREVLDQTDRTAGGVG